MAGAAALCLPTLMLTQVSLIARPRPRIMLLCVPAPWSSSTTQPDHRLHSVGGRRLPEAAMNHTLDCCRAAAGGCSMAARSSSRRGPCGAAAVCAVAGQGHTRGPDGRGSSILVLWAASPVHQDILPSWGGFGAPVSPLGCVCSVIRKIVRTWATYGRNYPAICAPGYAKTAKNRPKS